MQDRCYLSLKDPPARPQTKISQTPQILVYFTYRLSRMFVGCDKDNLNIRMKKEYSKKLAPAVARPAKYWQF